VAWDGGPQRLIDLVADRLRDQLPGLLAKQRTALGLSVQQLPDPVMHADWQPMEVGLDLMPSLWVSEVQSSATTGPWRSKPSGTENVITWRYQVGLDAYLRDVNPESLARQRRALLLAVRTCLLYRPGLFVPDSAADPYYSATVQQGLWQERYSNIGTALPQGVVGGFALSVQVDCEEQLDTWVPSPGQVDWIDTQVIKVPIESAWPPP